MKHLSTDKDIIRKYSKCVGDRFRESEMIMKLHVGNFNSNQNDGKTYVDRFFDKISYGSTDCWYWIGFRDGGGYGCMFYEGRMRRAHCVSWMLHHGAIEDGLKVLHKCDVRCCVNPDHLFLGTQQDNIRDMVDKQRHKSPCPRYGNDNPVSKLTQKQVDEIRSIKGKYTQKKISEMFNVSPMTISRIMNFKLWRKNHADQ